MGRGMRCSQEEQHLNETDDEDLSWRHFADVGACADYNTRCRIPARAHKHTRYQQTERNLMGKNS